MAAAQSRAEATWHGDLATGHGSVRVESGAFPDQPISWGARVQRMRDVTSPEELLASAHAGCYAMALSATLTRAGSPPTSLDVTATCTFDQVSGQFKITTMELDVRGEVAGLDQARFEELARQGEQACPVSNALRNNVEIRVTATLV